MNRHNTLAAEIDAAIPRYKAERICDWRPQWLPAAGKPRNADARVWAQGFWMAAALDPDSWLSYMKEERVQRILAPIMACAPLDVLKALTPEDEVEDVLEHAAPHIPASVLILRMIATMREDGPPPSRPPKAGAKIGRNDACPCGSGRKYKRCCADG